MPDVDLVIKDCVIVNAEEIVQGNLYVDGGRIVAISKDPKEEWAAGARVLDAEGRYVIPGLVDPHTHLGGRYLLEQDFRTETPGAVAGGITSIGIIHGSARATREFKEFVDAEDVIPWSKAYPIAREIGEEASLVDFFYIPPINTAEQAEEIPRLADDFGLHAYKFYANLKAPSSTTVGEKWKARIGIPISFDDSLIWYGFQQVAKIGPTGTALVHAENTEVAKALTDQLKAQGRRDPKAWTEKSPGWIEAEHVQRYSMFAREAGCRLYAVHLSSKEGYAAVKRSFADGTRLVVETAPHFLTLTCDDPPGPLLKVNPPIRYKDDNEALWQGIAEGVITCVGTDHVVTNRHEKLEKGDTSDRLGDPATDIWSTGSGLVGWPTLLPLMLSEGVHKGRITIEQAVAVCCRNPAMTFGLFPRKGAIRVGSDADLVILEFDETRTMAAEGMRSYQDFSLWEGWQLTGWPSTTVLRGAVVYENEEVTAQHGYGRALRMFVE